MSERRHCRKCDTETLHDEKRVDEVTGETVTGLGDWIYSGFGLDIVTVYVCQRCGKRTNK